MKNSSIHISCNQFSCNLATPVAKSYTKQSDALRARSATRARDVIGRMLKNTAPTRSALIDKRGPRPLITGSIRCHLTAI